MSELSVLIVEDDAEFRASMATLVSREGFVTHEVGTLEGARAKLAEAAPDVVLLDLDLPDGDGLDLLRDGSASANTEFVVMTGHAAVENVIAALREGVLDYLPKPADRSRLKAILANVARTRVPSVVTLTKALPPGGR